MTGWVQGADGKPMGFQVTFFRTRPDVDQANPSAFAASIASATLEQSHVVEDINQNVTQAASLAHNNAVAAQQSSDAGQHLGQLAEQLNRLLGQFRV